MKFWKVSGILLVLGISFPLFADVAEEKEKGSEDYKTILVSGTDSERMEALRHFAKEKDKSQIPAIINLLKDSENPKLASEAAITLGVIGEKGATTLALKDKIETTENGDIVYASVLAIYNIHKEDKETDPTAKQAIEYTFTNRRQDPFVVDLTEKIKAKFLSENETEEENKTKTNQPEES